MLGGASAAQAPELRSSDPTAAEQEFAESERLLLSGYEGTKAREDKIPPAAKTRLTEALESLVQLYDAWGKPHQAAEWRARLEASNNTGSLLYDLRRKRCQEEETVGGGNGGRRKRCQEQFGGGNGVRNRLSPDSRGPALPPRSQAPAWERTSSKLPLRSHGHRVTPSCLAHTQLCRASQAASGVFLGVQVGGRTAGLSLTSAPCL